MEKTEEEISTNEMTVLDINSEYRGIPRTKLMLNAGTAIAEFIKSLFVKNISSKPKLAFFCHNGGNGGDGFVAANLLSKLAKIDVYFTSNERSIKSKGALKNYKILKVNPDLN